MDKGIFKKGGSSDPFPTVSVEGAKAKGAVKKATLEPVWLDRFELPAEDPDSTATVQLDDHDLVGASDFMGPTPERRALCDVSAAAPRPRRGSESGRGVRRDRI